MSADLALALWLALGATAAAPDPGAATTAAPVAGAPVPAAPRAAPPLLTVEPGTLVLGRDGKARLTVVTGGEAPRLQTSAGRIPAVAETAPGTFTAELQAPVLSHPQIALVTAVTSAGAAFVPVPLVGTGVALARTAPGAPVTVQIRGRTFGPAVADEDGLARVPVEVPPGERTAAHGKRALDLHLPPIRRLAVALHGDAGKADREAVLTVYAAAATAEGGRWAGAPVSLAASSGEVSRPAEIAPGLFAATWRLPPGPPGTAWIEARAEDERSERAERERLPGALARVELSLSRDAAAAGGEVIEVVATAADAAGNGVDPAPALSVTAGTLSAPVRAGPGKVKAGWLPPRRLDGRAEVAFTAAAAGQAARRVLPLAAGAPSALAVEVLPAAVTADGMARAEVRAAVTDAQGNPLPGEPPALEARLGALGPAEPQPSGAVVARYTPRWEWTGGDEVLVARTGNLVSSAKLRVDPAPQTLAVGARAGLHHVVGGGTGPFLGAGVEWWPHRTGGGLGLGADLGWATAPATTRGFDLADGAHAVRATSSTIPATLTALLRVRLAPRLVGFAGLGGGGAAVHGAVTLDGRQVADEWGVAPEAHLAAALGWDFPRLRARARLEARAGWQGDPGLSALQGTARSFTLALGVTHDAL